MSQEIKTPIDDANAVQEILINVYKFMRQSMEFRVQEAYRINENVAKRFFVDAVRLGDVGEFKMVTLKPVKQGESIFGRLDDFAHDICEQGKYFNMMIEKFNKAAKCDEGEGVSAVKVPYLKNLTRTLF